MAFFKTSPNLPDGERARLEYFFQIIAEHIGSSRMTLPVLDAEAILARKSPEQLMGLLGEHLGHDVSEVKLQTFPMQTQKIGGGG